MLARMLEGFASLDTLAAGLPRAAFAMSLAAEVHPFADGNGRVARLLMNAELSAAGQARVLVPCPTATSTWARCAR